MQVYKVENTINGRIYVGKESRDNAKYLGSGLLIKRAVRKYGTQNFRKSILEVCSEKTVDDREIWWIRKLKSQTPKGYNITEGVTGGDVFKDNPRASEIKRRMSEARLGKPGRKHSRAMKAKISKLTKAAMRNPEVIEKMRMAKLGKPAVHPFQKGHITWNKGLHKHI